MMFKLDLRRTVAEQNRSYPANFALWNRQQVARHNLYVSNGIDFSLCARF